MHAMMFGHRGADLSGLVLMNSSRQSAANKPPMLGGRICTAILNQHGRETDGNLTNLWPQRTTFALPAPPPAPFATSRSTVNVVSQSARRMTASVYIQSLIMTVFYIEVETIYTHQIPLRLKCTTHSSEWSTTKLRWTGTS